jgi:uncharacterized protein (TIGR03435 family)
MRAITQFVALLAITTTAWLTAQTPSTNNETVSPTASNGIMRFEVASVKRLAQKSLMLRLSERGKVEIKAPLRMIIGAAYGIDMRVQRFRIVGGAEEIVNESFEIVAIPPENSHPAQHAPMLRELLAERFGLRVHTEARQLPIYALTRVSQDSLGPHLRPSAHNCGAFIAAGGRFDDPDRPRDTENLPVCHFTPDFDKARAGVWTIRNAGSILDLALETQPHVDRPVADATGLAGNYEWRATFATKLGVTEFEYPSIFTAFKRDLGLELERTTGPLEVTVIDTVALPTPN